MLASRIGKIAALIACLCAIAFFSTTLLSKFASDQWTSSDRSLVYSKAQSASKLSSGPNFPKLTGRVVDNAALLSASEKSDLIAKLKAFEDESSDQIVVATINSLDGENLEQYANQLFRHWKLGQAEENNGVLLLVAKNDRKLRIEVGYGLEGQLTDATSKIIIDQIIVPQFKSGNFGTGIIEGANWIVKILEGDGSELDARAKRHQENQGPLDDVDWPFVIFITIWATLFFGPILFSILAPIFGEKLGPNHYKWLGMEKKPPRKRGYDRSGNWHSGGGGWSSGGGGGGFSGGGGSSGGGGASGGW